VRCRLAAAVCVKDEARYLPQWVEWHVGQGFDKFMIFDNGSSPKQQPARVLWPYGDLVEVVHVPRHREATPSRWCLDLLPSVDCDWIWGGSLDEYLWCPGGGTVSELLRGYETTCIAALVVNWWVFTSRGPTDEGLLIERFTHATRDPNEHVKTIARQGQYNGWQGTHCADFGRGFAAVNELHHHVAGPWTWEFSAERIAINHYWCLSRPEFEVKMSKGRADKEGQEMVRRAGADEMWDELHRREPVEKTELAARGPWLRGQLLKRYGLI
jgi:hypothetical protein